MARIGFLSHADMSLHFFRRPIMQALKERGHEVFAIAPLGAYTQDLARDFNAVTYDLDRASLNPFTVFSNTKALARELKRLNLDLLQTAAHKSNVFGTLAAREAGIKYVINLVEGLGSFYIDEDIKTRLVRAVLEKLYKFSFSQADACVFVNDADPDYMLSRGLIAKQKVIRIKSVGVNAERFNPQIVSAADLGEDLHGKKIVLMIARAMWHKGVREFYEAAKILKDRSDAKFVFVGEGFAGNKSTADPTFLRSGAVHYLGARNDVPELLKASYLLALPSYKEGFPRTVLEAMSMARACVVSDCSGCVEAVQEGVNGLICRTRDAEDLARKIEILLDDPALCERLGRNGRELVLANYDEKIIAKKYLEVYRKFIDV